MAMFNIQEKLKVDKSCFKRGFSSHDWTVTTALVLPTHSASPGPDAQHEDLTELHKHSGLDKYVLVLRQEIQFPSKSDVHLLEKTSSAKRNH